MNDMTPETRQFGVTESAAKRIAFLIESSVEPDAKFMRVAILGGGCSGFQYEFSFDTEISEDDHRFERDGVTVLVDDTSLDLLSGAQLDFKDELIGSYFAIENPNASSSCGCGTSFSV